METVFIVTTEDRTIESVCDSLETALNFCREYAKSCDATIGDPVWINPADFEARGHWRVSCYPRDVSENGMGFLFDLMIDAHGFFTSKDRLSVNFPDVDSISHYLRQAE